MVAHPPSSPPSQQEREPRGTSPSSTPPLERFSSTLTSPEKKYLVERRAAVLHLITCIARQELFNRMERNPLEEVSHGDFQNISVAELVALQKVRSLRLQPSNGVITVGRRDIRNRLQRVLETSTDQWLQEFGGFAADLPTVPRLKDMELNVRQDLQELLRQSNDPVKISKHLEDDRLEATAKLVCAEIREVLRTLGHPQPDLVTVDLQKVTGVTLKMEQVVSNTYTRQGHEQRGVLRISRPALAALTQEALQENRKGKLTEEHEQFGPAIQQLLEIEQKKQRKPS
jgi:hypothetical protein